jgi:hypothetical protein
MMDKAARDGAEHRPKVGGGLYLELLVSRSGIGRLSCENGADRVTTGAREASFKIAVERFVE